MRHARNAAPLACRLLGHFWHVTYNRWTCKRCSADAGPVQYTKPKAVK